MPVGRKIQYPDEDQERVDFDPLRVAFKGEGHGETSEQTNDHSAESGATKVADAASTAAVNA